MRETERRERTMVEAPELLVVPEEEEEDELEEEEEDEELVTGLTVVGNPVVDPCPEIVTITGEEEEEEPVEV